MRGAALIPFLALATGAAPAMAQQLPDVVLARIVADAGQLLERCPTGPTAAACGKLRADFMGAYAGARTGKLEPMRQVADVLAEGNAAVRQDRPRGCSWAMIARVQGNQADEDTARVILYCLGLPEAEQRAAETAAKATVAAMGRDLQDIQRAQAKPPAR